MRDRNPTIGQMFTELHDLRKKLAERDVAATRPLTVSPAKAIAPTENTTVGIPIHKRLLNAISFVENLTPKASAARSSIAPRHSRAPFKQRETGVKKGVQATNSRDLTLAHEPNLDVYRSGRGQAPPSSKPSPVRLEDVLADMSKLRIHAPESLAKLDQSPDFISTAAEQASAILGLDFGTAFTKGVVQWRGKHFVVDWSSAVSGADPCLLPSTFSEHDDGRIVLGRKSGPSWVLHDGIKMRLLLSAAIHDDDAKCNAVLFVATAFRHACDWMRRRYASVATCAPPWRLHLGLPAASWDDEATASLFQTIAEAARNIAHQQHPISRESATRELRAAEISSSTTTSVMPEFACQLYSYLSSPQRQRDLHALVDVGAGTLDVAFFNVHECEGGDVLPIFSAAVEKLGTHYLIGALVGKKGESLEWQDTDSAALNDEIARKVNEPTEAVEQRRGAYLNCLADTINVGRLQAQKKYPTARAFHGEEPLRLFVCGGGCKIATIAERVRRIAEVVRKTYGMSVSVIPLPRPHGLVGDVGDEQYHRVAVAYGLSHRASNVGNVIGRRNIEPYVPAVSLGIEDRDATR